MAHLPTIRFRPIALGTLLVIVFAALHLSWLVFKWGGEAQHLLLGDLLYDIPAFLTAAVVLAAAFKHRGKVRRGWLLIGLGLAAQALGNGIWSFLELVLKIDPFPSVADFCYLLFGPLFAAGLLQLMPAPRDRVEGLRLGLDVAITVVAVKLYFWRFLLAPPLNWGMDTWTTSVTLAYPALDLVLLSLLLFMVMRERRGRSPRLVHIFIGLGITAQIAADLLYITLTQSNTYYTGHPIDALWTASVVFFSLAAFIRLTPLDRGAERARPTARLNGTIAIALPYLAVAAGFGLLLITATDPTFNDSREAKGVLYGAVLVTLLVVVRQLLAFGENWRLTRHLARQSSDLKLLSNSLEVKVRERTAELEALSRRFQHAALHDDLTGLPNRPHFHKRLNEMLGKDRPFAVLYLDFDDFKAVNDEFGHAVGDALLVAVSERLLASLRPEDLVARLGGDEFAIILERHVMADVVWIAERLTRTFQMPIQVYNHVLVCTVSIGVALAEGGSAEDVLRDADIAMYRAKAAGRSHFVVFEPTMREDVQVQ